MFHYTIEDKFMMIVSMGVIAVTCPISIHNHYLIVCISNCKKNKITNAIVFIQCYF